MAATIERAERRGLGVPGGGSAETARLDRWVVGAAIALTVAPLVVAAVDLTVRFRGEYQPIADMALTEMLTRDVGRHALMLGPYSRDGWYHPGPAMFYVLAGPYRLLGSASTGMNVGALLVNGTSVIGMAVIARRRGGTCLTLITLLACALLLRSLGPEQVRLHWNPYLTVLPYGLVVFLTWAMACGERWALPLAVAAASFVAQTHVGYVALAVPLLALGVGWLLVSVRERRMLVVPSLLGAAVGTVLWLPPAIQQVTNEPGNLGVVARWFRTGGSQGEGPRTLVDGWRVVSAQYGVPPEWLFGHGDLTWWSSEPLSLYQPPVPVLLAVVAGAAAYLWRRRVPDARQLVAVWCVASIAGIVAMARTVGLVYAYRLGWAWVLGMVGGVIVGWAAWTFVTSHRASLERRLLVPVSLLVLTALAVVGSVAHVRAGEPQGEDSRRLRELTPSVVAGLPPGDGEVVVDGTSSFGARAYGSSLVLQLERRGVEGRVPADDETVGAHRVFDGGRPRARLAVVADADIPRFEAEPSWELLAYSGDLPLDELRARVEEARSVQAGLEAGDLSRLADVEDAGIPPGGAVAVFIRVAPSSS